MNRMNETKFISQADIEAVPGQPARIFNLDDHATKNEMNKESYGFPFKELSNRRNQKKRIIDKWLVGTYNGMILVSELITEKELESGEGILRASLLYFRELEDTMELQWYTAPAILQLRYSMELGEHYKDKIFMTMQEIGIEYFTPAKRVIPQCLERKE